MRARLLMFRSCVSLGRHGLHPHIHLGSIVSQQPLPNMRKKYVNSMSSTTTSTSSFAAPEPPKSHGTPVFPDIHFENTLKPDNQSGIIRNSDSQAVFIVNGSSRGIGLQFVIGLLERTKGKVIACCRSPTAATSLINLASKHPDRIQILPLDMEDQSSIDALASIIAQTYHRVDALFNVAGILGDGKMTSGPERSLANIERDWMEKTLAVNVVGPTMLIKALSPLMRSTGRRFVKMNTRTSVKGDDQQMDPPEIVLPVGRPPTVVANLSARVGSISDNQLGGWYTYRLSKAALNQVTRTLGHELKRQGTWIVALHPGTTDTDLSKPFQGNVREGKLFPVEFTVDKLLTIVESIEEYHTGGFYDWAGKAIPF